MSQVAAPGTVIQIKVDEAWTCHCGAEQTKPGVWVAAHWREELIHTCKACGTERTLVHGLLTTPAAKAQKEPRP